MDLKLNEVSALLNVSENKIKNWVLQGKIPTYKLGKEYLFNRVEIEDWVMLNGPSQADSALHACKEKLLAEDDGLTLGHNQFSLYRAINKGGVYLDIEGSTKEEVIQNTAKKLKDKFGWDPIVISELLIDRENLMPTALNNGIGVPHTRDLLIDTHFDVIVVVFPKEPIVYGALDGLLVHTLFFLFACEDKRHLNLLAKLAHLASQSSSLKMLASKPDKSALLSYIKDWEASISRKY